MTTLCFECAWSLALSSFMVCLFTVPLRSQGAVSGVQPHDPDHHGGKAVHQWIRIVIQNLLLNEEKNVDLHGSYTS